MIPSHALTPRADGEQLILHTLWGGKVNRPLALALAAAWRRRIGTPVEIMHDDACITIAAPAIPPADEVLALVAAAEVGELLRESLAASGYFGARFRLAAACALLLPREGFGRRTPLWLSRQRAKELLAAVQRFDDFPIVLEAWRTCLEDEFELDALSLVLEELAARRIEVVEVRTETASPFAAGVSWRRTNALMYEDDTPLAGPARPRADLLREVVASAHLRPRLAPALVSSLERRVQRIAPGWAPRDAGELLEHVKERVLLPPSEWRDLLAAIALDWAADPAALAGQLEGKLVAVALGGGEPRFVGAVESLPRLLGACGIDAAAVELSSALLDGAAAPAARQALDRLLAARPPGDGDDAEEGEPAAGLVADVLRSYGPVSRERLVALLPMGPDALDAALAELADGQHIVVDTLLAGSDVVQVCLTENLERLLRSARAAARPAFEARSLAELPLFLASWHGLGAASAGGADLEAALERLFGYAAPAELWETEILPARLDPYYPAWLDALLAETGLEWVGCGEKRLAFVFSDDRELIGLPESEAGAGSEANSIFPPGAGRFTFEELLARSERPSAELTATLWRLAWAGAAANDSFAAVRRGLASRFQPPAVEAGSQRGPHSRRAGFARWRSARPFAGHWRRLAPPVPPVDAVEHEERNRRRARLLLDRYGVLFRELLERELPPLVWAALSRTLRVMELSGEVVSGQFFAGIAGLQVASHAALRRLEHGLPGDRVFWLSAADPISPCGLGLTDLSGLPHRLPGNHLVYHGSRLVVSAERRGRRLAIDAAPDHPDLPRYLAFLKVALARAERPAKTVVIEEINGAPAAASPYREALAALFHVGRDGATLRLSRRY